MPGAWPGMSWISMRWRSWDRGISVCMLQMPRMVEMSSPRTMPPRDVGKTWAWTEEAMKSQRKSMRYFMAELYSSVAPLVQTR
ncbi:hypothetical protein DSECCO2_570670 [anaerobic digester metagenome]